MRNLTNRPTSGAAASRVAAPRAGRAEAERAIEEMVAARRAWLVYAEARGYEPKPHTELREREAAAVVGYGRPEWAKTGYALGDWTPYADEPLWKAWRRKVGAAYQSVQGLVTARVGAALLSYRIPTTDALVDELYSVARDKALHGLDLYDPAQGRAPSTYLCHWIRAGIQRTITSSRRARVVALDLQGAGLPAFWDPDALLDAIETIDARTAKVTSPRRRRGSLQKSTRPSLGGPPTSPRS